MSAAHHIAPAGVRLERAEGARLPARGGTRLPLDWSAGRLARVEVEEAGDGRQGDEGRAVVPGAEEERARAVVGEDAASPRVLADEGQGTPTPLGSFRSTRGPRGEN